MTTDTDQAKRFDEIVGKPIMTAQQRIEQMKREKEAASRGSVSEQSSESAQPAQVLQAHDSEIALTKKAILQPEKKKKAKTLTYEMLQDCFRPKEITMPRIQRTIHTREDAMVLEGRLLNILGGVGARHLVGKERFNVSLSAFYTHLILSFFEAHKDEIEALEQQQLQQKTKMI